MDTYLSWLKRCWLRVLCVVAVLVLCLPVAVFASETVDDEDVLPHVAMWVNGFAVAESGAFLSDTWAVDDTGVSDKTFVLVGQDCTEVMRVNNYPEDITNGDTAPCEKYPVTISLDLPENATGNVVVRLENDTVSYNTSFTEKDGYTATVAFYPGLYEITLVEVAGDIQGSYTVGNYLVFEPSSETAVSFEVIKDTSIDATVGTNETIEGGVTDGTSEGNGGEGPTPTLPKDNELLMDTVKLAIAVAVLLIVYAIIKLRRAKSEEAK